ncbi:MAG: 3-deoxy-manno-octulosonate cytidylyltransferase, partial [Alphaproteobacteria bacterium]
MNLPEKPIITIPARMVSSRLPGKPLAEIDGLPMIVQVLNRAMEADIGPVIVACGESEIADVITAHGGTAILTRPDHPSGSDRVFEAVETFDPDGKFGAVVNLQGDLPALDPKAISAVFQPLENPETDVATLVAEIRDAEELDDDAAVKAVVSLADGARIGRALWFSRLKTPWG